MDSRFDNDDGRWHLTIEEAAAALSEGKVVAVPTETSYGLAADVRSSNAVASVLRLKRRPATSPSPILVRSITAARDLLNRPPPRFAHLLMERYWPGALTVIVPAPQHWLPREVALTSTVALRQDGHPDLQRLLATAGCDVTGTSANLSGAPAMYVGAEVSAIFGGEVGYAGHVGSESLGSAPSTLVTVTGDKLGFLRHGAVSAAEIDMLWRRAGGFNG